MSSLGLVEIDLGALARNYRRLSEAGQPGMTGAVVKANAYGLGVEPIARRLAAEGCGHFFVATLAEGIELRAILSAAEIFVFAGLAGSSSEAFTAARLVPVLNTLKDFRQWGGAGPAAVHFDTGMNRLGLGFGDVAELRTDAAALAATDVQWVMTHLACADEPDRKLNQQQIERFAELVTLWPDARTSVGNSAGSLLGEHYRSDLSRPGIALYGGNPYRRGASPVEPVVTVKGKVLQLRSIEAGESVGYGASFIAERKLTVAIVGVGYADGYLRSLSNCGIAVVAGHRVPVVGRVSMDLVCFDVSEVPADALDEGDWVTLVGDSVTLEELAALAGTVNYEMLTALGTRFERVYRDS